MKRQTTRKLRFAPGGLERLEARILFNGDFRTIDGVGNNLEQANWGAANVPLMRLVSVAYEDGVSEPAGGADGSGRPNPREISNRVNQQLASQTNDRGLSGFVFQWGQFLDHDMDLTEEAVPFEPLMIAVPAGDAHLDPQTPIPLLRSRYDAQSGSGADNPRQQINQITSYIDASNVYGADAQRAAALRSGVGGQLRTSTGDLLPFNEFGLHNAAPGPDPTAFFLAGDIRANEQPGLTSLHTLFMREHNRLAELIAARDFAGADLSIPEVDEAIYQAARRIVGAEIQAVTYQEFLPALLGPDQLSSYGGYDSSSNATIANLFSAAVYRVGHTMLPPELLRLAGDGQVLPQGNLALSDAFFRPELIQNDGIEPYLQGLGVLQIQEIDTLIVDQVRNMLFDPPAQFDLASINMQRGRDHGLPDYNQVRRELGLPPARKFRDLSSDRQVRRAIRDVYGGDLNNIDVWLGAIAEDHIPGGSVGNLVQHVLVDQFSRLRDGDRFYFENDFSGSELLEIQGTRLADIIRRNTEITNIQDEVFRHSSVFVFRAEAGADGVDLTARVGAAGQIEIVDNADGSVLAARDLAETSSVVLFGSGGDDRLLIDGSLARLRRVPVEVHGEGGEDWLKVHGGRRSERIMVKRTSVRINQAHVYFGNVEHLYVGGGAGNDLLRVREDPTASLVMDGEAGRDRLASGSGSAILLGGAGNDALMGGNGRDLLIGGAGRDNLAGRRGEDVLIHGETMFADHLSVLTSLLAEWNSSRSFDQRVANLLGSGEAERLNGDDFLVMGETVMEDHDLDTLMGGRNWDFYFVGQRDRMSRPGRQEHMEI